VGGLQWQQSVLLCFLNLKSGGEYE